MLPPPLLLLSQPGLLLPMPIPQQVIDPVLLEASENLPQSQRVRQSSNPVVQRSLAQPMGQNWVRKRQEAMEIDTISKSLKAQHQEIMEEKKRTCDVIIWFEVRVTSPQLQNVH